MNICVFGASFLPKVGGMEYVMHHLATALVRRGMNVRLIAEKVNWNKMGIEPQYQLSRYGLPVRGANRAGIITLHSIWTVLREHRKTPFDVLHCHSLAYAGRRASLIKQLINVPVVMTPHGEDVQRIPEINYGLRLDERWNKKIGNNLNHADAVTAISKSLAMELDQVDAAKVFQVPNGIHVDQYGKTPSTYLRNRLGLDSGQRVILSAGRNHVKKGYKYGILAMRDLLQDYRYAQFHYVIVGKGVSQLAPIVKSCNLEAKVSLVEVVPTELMKECYHSSDIFFSPSIVEGLSLVSIEAMACGLPLVVTDVPGNEDIVTDNECGLIVRNKDTGDMARGLHALLEDDSLYRKFSDRAVEQSVNYDWDRVAGRYIDVYKFAMSKQEGAQTVKS